MWPQVCMRCGKCRCVSVAKCPKFRLNRLSRAWDTAKVLCACIVAVWICHVKIIWASGTLPFKLMFNGPRHLGGCGMGWVMSSASTPLRWVCPPKWGIVHVQSLLKVLQISAGCYQKVWDPTGSGDHGWSQTFWYRLAGMRLYLRGFYERLYTCCYPLIKFQFDIYLS